MEKKAKQHTWAFTAQLVKQAATNPRVSRVAPSPFSTDRNYLITRQS